MICVNYTFSPTFIISANANIFAPNVKFTQLCVVGLML